MANTLPRWLPLWVVPLLILYAVFTVWMRLSIVRTSYRIDESERMIRSLSQAKEKLELKLASKRSPSRLELLARTRFKLAPPRADQVRSL